ASAIAAGTNGRGNSQPNNRPAQGSHRDRHRSRAKTLTVATRCNLEPARNLKLNGAILDVALIVIRSTRLTTVDPLRRIQTDEYRADRLEGLKQIAAGHGGACLATHYLKSTAKLRWRCARGHEWDALPDNIARGHWCMICGNERQGRAKAHSIDMMREVAASRGGQCLSTIYKNNLTKLRWRCARGHEWEAVLGSIVGSGKPKGSWCPICVGKLPKELAFETLKELAVI